MSKAIYYPTKDDVRFSHNNFINLDGVDIYSLPIIKENENENLLANFYAKDKVSWTELAPSLQLETLRLQEEIDQLGMWLDTEIDDRIDADNILQNEINVLSQRVKSLEETRIDNDFKTSDYNGYPQFTQTIHFKNSNVELVKQYFAQPIRSPHNDGVTHDKDGINKEFAVAVSFPNPVDRVVNITYSRLILTSYGYVDYSTYISDITNGGFVVSCDSVHEVDCDMDLVLFCSVIGYKYTNSVVQPPVAQPLPVPATGENKGVQDAIKKALAKISNGKYDMTKGYNVSTVGFLKHSDYIESSNNPFGYGSRGWIGEADDDYIVFYNSLWGIQVDSFVSSIKKSKAVIPNNHNQSEHKPSKVLESTSDKFCPVYKGSKCLFMFQGNYSIRGGEPLSGCVFFKAKKNN